MSDTVYARVRANPRMLKQRKEIIEHIFGALKRAMVHDHFLLRTRPKVAAEVSLRVLTYNLKRVLNILGVPTLLKQLQALFSGVFVLIVAARRRVACSLLPVLLQTSQPNVSPLIFFTQPDIPA